jgi:hypothetical protein
VAQTRLVLMNVRHSDRILDEMVSLVRPGGVEDVDWISRVCAPAHPAWERLVSAVVELWRRKGMDVYLEHGLLTESEFAAELDARRAHLDRPDTVVVHATLFQAWGTVPA